MHAFVDLIDIIGILTVNLQVHDIDVTTFIPGLVALFMVSILIIVPSSLHHEGAYYLFN